MDRHCLAAITSLWADEASKTGELNVGDVPVIWFLLAPDENAGPTAPRERNVHVGFIG